MSKHKKHAEADLVDALEHIVYEIWKYKQSIADFGEIARVGGDAAIEFRVLHHRILLEFFYDHPKREDDIVAGEYIDDWQIRHPRTSAPWLDRYMKRCHTMFAHISKTRSDLAKMGLKAWDSDWQTVEPHINNTIIDFLGVLSTSHKSICRQWINRWSAASCPGNDVLGGLADIASLAE